MENQSKAQNEKMQKYYEWQSKIYDSTRWSFLFGRHKIIQAIPTLLQREVNILEIGCGTGVNILKLARKFKTAKITGLDVSADMIELSKKNTDSIKDRVTLLAEPYVLGDTRWNNSIDIILFSYSLTMINPQWKELLQQAKSDLKEGGAVAVVDFYDSNFSWFKNHMGNHHVRMDGHILPVLEDHFDTFYKAINPAYLGIWHYFLYVGKKF